MNAAIELLLGFGTGYLAATLLESYLHEHVSDARPRAVAAWKRAPRWLRALVLQHMIKVNYSHHTIHHRKTYRRDYVTRFASAAEQAEVDRELARSPHGVAVRKALYGSKFTPLGWLAFVSPLVPPFALIVVAFGGWAAVGALAAMALPPAFSNYVHPYLHMPLAEARAAAPWPIAALLGTRYGRAMMRNHFLHHRDMRGNFNLLLGGDWLRGRARRPNERDVAEMERLGIPRS